MLQLQKHIIERIVINDSDIKTISDVKLPVFSICYIQFYIVFVPMCFLKNKLKKNYIFAFLCLIISICWWMICYIVGVTDTHVWGSFFLQYIWEFSLGMVLADIFLKGKRVRINVIILATLALVGISLQAFMAIKSETLKCFNDIPALIGYASLALLFMCIPSIKKRGEWLSKISYEYYLIHMLIFSSVMHFAPKDNLIIQAIN